jgi:hypothetical protein
MRLRATARSISSVTCACIRYNSKDFFFFLNPIIFILFYANSMFNKFINVFSLEKITNISHEGSFSRMYSE